MDYESLTEASFFWAPAMLTFYLLIVAITLLNLLIAVLTQVLPTMAPPRSVFFEHPSSPSKKWRRGRRGRGATVPRRRDGRRLGSVRVPRPAAAQRSSSRSPSAPRDGDSPS